MGKMYELLELHELLEYTLARYRGCQATFIDYNVLTLWSLLVTRLVVKASLRFAAQNQRLNSHCHSLHITWLLVKESHATQTKYQIPTLKYDYYSVPLPNIVYNTSSIVLSKTAYTWYTNDILWSIYNQRITRAMLFSNGKQPFSWTSPPISNSLLSQTLTTTSRRAQRGNFLSFVQYIN